MFLSQLMLNARSRQVQNEMRDPYEMHRTLCRAFTEGVPKEEKKAALEAARLLFRVEEDKGALHVLAQSKTEPDWSFLASPYLQASPRCKPFEPSVREGQSVRFRLLANPTFRPFIARDARSKKNVERVGLYREHERLDWLLHRGRNEYGFALQTQNVTLRARELLNGGKKLIVFRGREHEELKIDLPCVDVADLNDGRRFPLPGSKQQFSAARFDGVLQVTDADKFQSALENGIGSAKGFGFGLLSVARLIQ